MKIAIIQFPGSNCERETMLAVKRANMEPVEFLWNQPKEILADFAGYIIVGGFSYEDRSRAGIIAALDPIITVLKQQSDLGKPILGICNGAQILVESGLVPGIENNKMALVLTDNKRIQNGKVLGTGYYNAWVSMRVSDAFQYNAFTRLLTPNHILQVPVAHGEGRFVISPGLLQEMQENGLNVFQYCDDKGNVIDHFPVNPNGSIDNIAAISNKAGNVMAMMPHPERTAQGDLIFQSMQQYIAEGCKQTSLPLHYYPRQYEIKNYATPQNEWLVDSIITDNQALSVENALNHLALPVTVRRTIHWEIDCDCDEELHLIKNSGVLFNARKEILLNREQYQAVDPVNKTSFLVRAKEDMIGQQKLQMLKDHFGIQKTRSIRQGVLWQMDTSKKFLNEIINSHILFNPYAHDCYYY